VERYRGHDGEGVGHLRAARVANLALVRCAFVVAELEGAHEAISSPVDGYDHDVRLSGCLAPVEIRAARCNGGDELGL
jgi:hypothetical protein